MTTLYLPRSAPSLLPVPKLNRPSLMIGATAGLPPCASGMKVIDPFCNGLSSNVTKPSTFTSLLQPPSQRRGRAQTKANAYRRQDIIHAPNTGAQTTAGLRCASHQNG